MSENKIFYPISTNNLWYITTFIKNAVKAISDFLFCRLPSAPDNVPFGYFPPNFPLFCTIDTVLCLFVEYLRWVVVDLFVRLVWKSTGNDKWMVRKNSISIFSIKFEIKKKSDAPEYFVRLICVCSHQKKNFLTLPLQ